MIQGKAKISVVPARLTCGKFLPDPQSANQIEHFGEMWLVNASREGVPPPPSSSTHLPPRCHLAHLGAQLARCAPEKPFLLGSCGQMAEAQGKLWPWPCRRAPSVTNTLRTERDGPLSEGRSRRDLCIKVRKGHRDSLPCSSQMHTPWLFFSSSS